MLFLVCLLNGYKHHIKNMRNFDEKQIEIQKEIINNICFNDNLTLGIDRIRISQMIWGSYFMKGRITQLGRLQNETTNDIIKIHIPKGKELNDSEVEESITQAKKFIKTKK